MPKFSVIMPVHNAEKFLREALESVRTQTFADWECVCVDDGSTDASGGILDEFAARDARFVVLHQANGGVSSARNAGLDAARGEWIGWLDADDLYSPGRLAEAARLADAERPDLVRLACTMGREMPPDFLARDFSAPVTVLDEPRAVAEWGWNVLIPAGMAWQWYARRDMLRGLRFRPEMRVKEDCIFSAMLVPRLRKVVHEGHRSLFYRQQNASAMHVKRRAQDAVNFQRALLEVWHASREHAAAVGALEALRANVRRASEGDLVDIVCFGGKTTRAEWRAVKERYDAVRTSGAFSSRRQSKKRHLLSLPLYNLTGIRWPIFAMERGCRLLGGIWRRFCRGEG